MLWLKYTEYVYFAIINAKTMQFHTSRYLLETNHSWNWPIAHSFAMAVIKWLKLKNKTITIYCFIAIELFSV